MACWRSCAGCSAGSMGQLASSLGLLAKAVPLLAIFALLSFTTEEMWDIFADPGSVAYVAVIGLFVVLGTAFLLVRVPRETRRLEREAGEDGPPLSRAQRVNVGLVLFVSQAVQVLIVSLTIGAFFVALRVARDRRRRCGPSGWTTRATRCSTITLWRRAVPAHRGAAAGRRRARRLLRLLLRRRDAHRLDLPRGVPRGADRRDARQLHRPQRVPAAARAPGGHAAGRSRQDPV